MSRVGIPLQTCGFWIVPPNLAQCDGEGLPICFGCARRMACGPRFTQTEKEDYHGPD